MFLDDSHSACFSSVVFPAEKYLPNSYHSYGLSCSIAIDLNSLSSNKLTLSSSGSCPKSIFLCSLCLESKMFLTVGLSIYCNPSGETKVGGVFSK